MTRVAGYLTEWADDLVIDHGPIDAGHQHFVDSLNDLRQKYEAGSITVGGSPVVDRAARLALAAHPPL